MGKKARQKAMRTLRPTTPTELRIPVPFVNALIGYLLKQPCQDVLPFINGLGELARQQGLQPAPPNAEPPKEPPSA